jgi:hypothetical protein
LVEGTKGNIHRLYIYVTFTATLIITFALTTFLSVGISMDFLSMLETAAA